MILATTAAAAFVKGVPNLCNNDGEKNPKSKARSKLRLWNIKKERDARPVDIEVVDEDAHEQ